MTSCGTSVGEARWPATTARGEREGKTLEDRQAHVLHIKDRKVTEYWAHPGDQYTIDEFFA